MLSFILPFLVLSKECTYTSNLISISDDSSLEDIKDPLRPIFLRLTSPGCPYSPPSQAQWERAAELYPHVNFVTVNSWANTKISSLFGTSIFTPTHALVAANSTSLIQDTIFGHDTEIVESPQKFLDLIQQHTNLYPLAPPLMSLTPIMIDSFYNSIDDPIILLYNSRCSDEVPFINEWTKISNEVIFPNGDNPRIGILDCSIYPDECKRWSFPYVPQTPRALIYSSKTGNYEVLDTYNDITTDKINGLYSNAISRPNREIPTPLPIPEPEQGEPSTTGFTILQNSDLQSRSVNTIRTEYKESFKSPSSGCETASDCDSRTLDDPSKCFYITPSTDDHQKSLKIINFFRRLAGLTNDVTEDPTWSSQCNHTSINIHKIGRVPSDHKIKPDHATSTYCGESGNIQVALDSLLSENCRSVFESSYKLFRDEGQHNDGVVGHRRWLLHPLLSKIGLGFYPYKEENMGNYRLQRPATTVIRIKEGQTPAASNGVPSNLKFVSWPPSGPFPLNQLPTNWHITHPDFTTSTLENLRVVVTRDDGLRLSVEKVYLSQKNSYGDSVIIKMTNEAISRCLPMRTITVSVFNDALKKLYRFSFELFGDDEVTEICFYSSNKNNCPSSVSQENMFGPGNYQAAILSNAQNPVKIHVVDQITIDGSLTFSAKTRFFLSGKAIKGDVVIQNSVILDVENPTETSYNILWSVKDKTIGKLETAFKAKQITIDVQNDDENSGLYDLVFYTGVQTNCGVSRTIFYGTDRDSFYTIGGTNGNYLVMTSTSPAYQEFNAGSDSEHDKPNIIQIHTVFDMKNQKTNKRVIKVYVSNVQSQFPMNLSAFIPGRKRDYQFIMVGGDMYFECDLNISKYANSITFLRNNDYQSSQYEFDVSMPKYIVEALDERNICPMDFVTVNGARFTGDSNDKVLMPYLKGDDVAKTFNDISKFYDFYPLENAEDTGELEAYQPKTNKIKCLITTPGGHESYTVKVDVDENPYKVYIFRPSPGTEEKPIKITLNDVYVSGNFPTSVSETYRLFFENYKNLSLNMPAIKYKSDVPQSYLHLYFFDNCGEVHFLGNNLNEEQLAKTAELDININLGHFYYGATLLISSVKVQDSDSFDASSIQTKKLSVSANTTPTIKKITVKENIQIESATVFLEDCTIEEEISLDVKKTEGWWPSLSLHNTPIKPKQIKVDLGIVPESATVLDASDEYESHTIISGISSGSKFPCSSIKGITTLTNNGKFELECIKNDEIEELIVIKGKENAPILTPDKGEQQTSPPDDTNNPIITPQPEETIILDFENNEVSENELNNKLTQKFDEMKNDGSTTNVVIIENLENVQFNRELESYQFIKPPENSQVNFIGGNLNLVLPKEVTVVLSAPENPKLLLKGEGSVNIKINEEKEAPSSIKLETKSEINGSLKITVPNSVSSFSIQSLDLSSHSSIVVKKEDESIVKVTVDDLSAKAKTTANLNDLKIEKSLKIEQSAVLNVQNVDVESASINYNINDFTKLPENQPFFNGVFKHVPASFMISRSDSISSEKPTENKEYTIVSGQFENMKCVDWYPRINLKNSGFNSKECLDVMTLDSENKRIVIKNDPSIKDNGGKKLGPGEIAGIVIGVIAAVAIIVVVVFFVIKRKKNLVNSSDVDDGNTQKANENEEV